VIGHAPLQFLGRSVGDDAPPVDDDRTGANGLDFLEDVGRDDDRLVPGHLRDQLAHMVLLVRIEAIRRLVHDQHRGVVQYGLGEPDPTLVALGQRVNRLFQHRPQARAFDGQGDLGLVDCAIEASNSPDKAQECRGRHLAVGRRTFRQVPDLRLGELWPLGHVDAADPSATAVRLQKARQHLHRGRLAGTVGAKEAQHLAARDLKRDLSDGCNRAKCLPEALSLDQDTHTSLPRARPCSVMTDAGPSSRSQIAGACRPLAHWSRDLKDRLWHCQGPSAKIAEA
jgi:hypothetical protein